MILPQDYVNYVKLVWSDSAGIEHIIYPTGKTSNPNKVAQDSDGNYIFDDIVSIDFCLDLIKETIKSESIRITRETFKVLNDLILISDKLVKELKS